MERPDTPTVEPSEPEQERMMVDAILEKVTDPDTLKQVNLVAAYEYLYGYGFELDEEGFIIHRKSGEYATPYTFGETRFEATEGPADNPLQSYFVPMDSEEGRRAGQTKERLHLTDLHTVMIGADDEPHPVDNDVFSIEQLHRKVGIRFDTVMGWSTALQTAHIQGYVDEVEIEFDTFPSEAMGSESWEINCFAPECDFSGHPDEWNGEENEPECPECENPWHESVTVCMSCQDWHMNMNFEGDSIYAEPRCPHCGAGVSKLEVQTRYDEF